MNLPDSLACEQALGLGVGGERKEVFVPPPPPPSPSEFARRCVIDDQARWILAKFFLFTFLWTETKSKSIITLKKVRGQLKPSHLDRTSLVNKNILYAQKQAFRKP